MVQLFVCVLRSSKGDVEFAVSHREQKHQAIADWEQDGFDVIDIIDVEVSSVISDSPSVVIRGLASSVDGAETLSRLLKAVADHQKSWHDLPPAVIHE